MADPAASPLYLGFAGESSALPLHLGFVGDSENKPMETEGGRLAATLVPKRGKKRPPSPSLSDDEEWLVSSSEEDEDHEDNDDKGTYQPFTVDDIPRPSCDFEQQSHVMFRNEEARLRGPLPIRLLPPFRSGNHPFGSAYNLADKSQISVDGAGDCPNECQCLAMLLLQFIDIKIAGYRHTHAGQAKIYGFIAVRESTERSRNYVYQREIENCESVSVKRKTGVARLSLTSPARVISMISHAFIEFEVHVRNEDETSGDDNLIIEGCTELENVYKPIPLVEHQRIYGERCALDIKYMLIANAVEARIEVTVLRLSVIPSNVNMKLYAKTSGFSEVIRLFQGTPPEPGIMMTSFAVAVERHNGLDLFIESSLLRGNAIPSQKLPQYLRWQCSFACGYHGTSEKVAELGDFAAFSVKVTWRSYWNKARD